MKWEKVNKKSFVLIVVSGLSFAFFLYTMLHNLMFSPLWGDEWVEYTYSQLGLRNGDMYQAIISTYQPPLYNWIMHFWLSVSTNVFWFRLFNVVVGMASAAFLFATVRKVYNAYIADVVIVALAAVYQWIYCIQECSEYALMLLFLFASLYAYICLEEKYTVTRLGLFIVACVAAIYSQYGAVFVIGPLLMLEGGRLLLSKEISNKNKVIVAGSYLASGLVFAIPLYIWFMKPQMANQQTTGNRLPFAKEMLSEVHVKIGQIFAYFLNLQDDETWNALFMKVGIIILIMVLILIVKPKIEGYKRRLAIVFMTAYLLHVVLVEMHIYGMVAVNESAGFYWRYSYFYIPLLCILLPICIGEFSKLFPETSGKVIIGILCGVLVIPFFFSYKQMMLNWKKSNDDVVAQEWLAHEGWKEPTYLVEYAANQFEYWIPKYCELDDSYRENLIYINYPEDVDMNNLPEKFYVWQTNWPRAVGQQLIESALNQGYEYERYAFFNDGYGGILIYFYQTE